MSEEMPKFRPRQFNQNSGGEDDLKAVIYARTSSVTQQFGYSLDEQVRQCWEQCMRLRWKVIRIFKDEAESGDDIDRPQFQRMMALARSGHFDVVVFWKLDRFSRSILHAVELERDLRDHDIALHSVTEQLDTSTSSGRFNFRNIASAAEFERDHIKERSQMGFKALALDNKWPNQDPPLGYDLNDDATLSINTEESETIEKIFDWYRKLQSMPKVSAKLNEDGLETKDGGDWTARTVNKILRNGIYCGRYSVADVEETVPEYRIVSEDTFDEVTEIRFRFQNNSANEQESMSNDRKSEYADRVLSSYRQYLKIDETGGIS
jgi:site-specific DNA recombinase